MVLVETKEDVIGIAKVLAQFSTYKVNRTVLMNKLKQRKTAA